MLERGECLARRHGYRERDSAGAYRNVFMELRWEKARDFLFRWATWGIVKAFKRSRTIEGSSELPECEHNDAGRYKIDLVVY